MPATDSQTFIAEPGGSQVITSRLLPAPPEKVFQAFTDPDLIAQWWGPRKYETIIDEYEPRRGGCWRFIHKDGDDEFGFRGVIHELLLNERITQTFEFEGMPGHVVLEQLKLASEGDGTRVTTVSAFTSVEDRDGMVNSGMEGGLTESYDRLEELVQTM
ncbi:MAG: SRPBCC family protein [Thermoleophilaceae bacterium]|nr:SRPBCC family protein [Thermoleophilaceae bacterium]